MLSTGHLISKCLFGVSNSLKNEEKRFDLWYQSIKVEFFRSSFGRIEDTKKEILKSTGL